MFICIEISELIAMGSHRDKLMIKDKQNSLPHSRDEGFGQDARREIHAKLQHISLI